jgi:hypothetical protein
MAVAMVRWDAIDRLVVTSLLPSYVRAYRVLGDSDAPGYVTGDRVVVNLAAYDVRIPSSDRVLAPLGNPKPGEMVLLRDPDDRLAPSGSSRARGPTCRCEATV